MEWIHIHSYLFPRAFIIGRSDWNSSENATMTYRAKWFTSPSKNTGVVILEDPRNQLLAKRVLIEHGYFAELQEKNDGTNAMINIACIPNIFQHDSLFEKYVREMLQVNGVGVKRVYLNHSYKGMHDVDEMARRTVYRAIVEYLIRNHEWHDPHPLSIYDWKKLMNRDLPWHWHLLEKNGETESEEGSSSREAELIFDDVDCGLRMVDVLAFSDKELEFSNGYDPPQRIVMKPIYCVQVYVTKEVRVACDSFIRELNEEESTEGDPMHSLEIVDKTWTANYEATDDSDTSEGELSVQGWPREHVEEVAMRLISYFGGSYIDCSNDVNGKLLYGYGANFVESLRQRLRGKAVIDVDLLQERITLVGEQADYARKELEFFAAKSQLFVVTLRIAIKPPRYLHFMRNALRFVGLEKLSAISGNAMLRFVDAENIEFRGTLKQYDLLMDYLEEVDGKLVSTSSAINYSSKPNCPVCLSPVSNAFYCLDCGHYYCLKCIIYQVKTLVRNRDLPLRCYHVDCGHLFSINDLKCLFLGDSRLPWLSAKKMLPLVESSIDYLLQNDRSLLRCPTPDCFGIFKKDEISKGHGKRAIMCDSCKHSRCGLCMMEPHEGVSCEAYATLRSDEAASLQAYLASNKDRVRACPTDGCGALIQKGEGCNHMHCTVCNTHFCWLCGFSSVSQSEVYGHLREVHGAIGDQWPLLQYDGIENVIGRFVLDMNDDDVLIPLAENLW
uniref:RBR-type E3 ubiquitin transferase n=1 Tax=Haemonchus contortus TaxID=6289 RepID=A0A7I4Y5Y5_HAECO